MHEAFQVSACPLAFALPSRPCARVSLPSPRTRSRDTPVDRKNREHGGTRRETVSAARIDRCKLIGKNWQLYDSIPPLASFPRGASRHRQRDGARGNREAETELSREKEKPDRVL